MKKLFIKLKCWLGLHDRVTIGVSEYHTRSGFCMYITKGQIVKRCTHCHKTDIPEWYSKDYRLLNPPLDSMGWPTLWKPDDFMV